MNKNITLLLSHVFCFLKVLSGETVSDKEVEVLMVKRLHLAGDRDSWRKQRQKKADKADT